MDNQDPTITKVDDNSFMVTSTVVSETVIDVRGLLTDLANAQAQVASLTDQIAQATAAGIDVEAIRSSMQ